MDFIHRGYDVNRTIAAIATPAGEGGISVIRISGNEAFSIASRIFSKDLTHLPSHTAHYGKILSESGECIDQVLVLIMRNPTSFTGEDVVEIHCHGGFLITSQVLQRVLEAGASSALAGEFSFKAFMHGKVDLTQAESIQALISSKNAASMKAARQHLEGRLKQEISFLQKNITEIAAIFEAWVDYPEEGLEFASKEEIVASLSSLLKRLNSLIDTYSDGQKITKTIKLALLGAPNAGKSSLLNLLAGKDRAIVTEIAGTTRDTLDVELSINGLSYELTDTAGIRETDEIIEQEGIKRSFKAAEAADLVLFVIDARESINPSLFSTLDPDKTILVWNKMDLLGPQSFPHVEGFTQVLFSVKEYRGCKELKEKIEQKIQLGRDLSKDQILITSERHYLALKQAHEFVSAALDGLTSDLSPELLLIDLKESLTSLGEIIGTNVTEDILSAIFSKFCVGK